VPECSFSTDASSTGATVGPAWLGCESGAGGDHRRLPGVDGGDDLGDVDALQIDGCDAEAGMSQLALDDVERDPLVREFDGVGVAELVRREPAPHTGALVMSLAGSRAHARIEPEGSQDVGAAKSQCRAGVAFLLVSGKDLAQLRPSLAAPPAGPSREPPRRRAATSQRVTLLLDGVRDPGMRSRFLTKREPHSGAPGSPGFTPHLADQPGMSPSHHGRDAVSRRWRGNPPEVRVPETLQLLPGPFR
jgi:hypothetical protein